MKKVYILFYFICFCLCGSFSQTLQQARSLYESNNYVDAKPVFEKYVKSSPSNGNYNFWYGVCCLKTGEPEKAIPYLETAVKKRITGGQLYLAQAYHDSYHFQNAVDCYEEYIAELEKRKKPTEIADSLLERSKMYLRMIKGVEEVCVIDSFVVDKVNFLEHYKISEDAGTLYNYNDFFKASGENVGTVYQNEIESKIYYSETGENGTLDIFSKSKLDNEWGRKQTLPSGINGSGNANYAYVLSDGITIYYATDGEGLGGYDIYVTRYNTNTDTYLTPENVGMPFNSPYNDYMYVVDEYNNLGWFASDRFQPDGKVCIYVFIPNVSKQTYNFEIMDAEKMIRLAKLYSLKETWNDESEVKEALARLQMVLDYKPKEHRKVDFELVIDDNRTYHVWGDFKSAEAKKLFQHFLRLKKDYLVQEDKLEKMRLRYIQSGNEEKIQLSPSILDLEKRVLQMNIELDTLEVEVRNKEKVNLK